MSNVQISQLKLLSERQRELSLSLRSEPPAVRRSGHVAPLLTHPIEHLSAEKAFIFGVHSDFVMETAPRTVDGGFVEVGYYAGDTKRKSIIKVSPQLGCPVSCKFCEAAGERFRRNLKAEEIYDQAALALQIVSRYGLELLPEHKVSFAGTGEPLLNLNTMEALVMLSAHRFSFKVSTVMPAGNLVRDLIGRMALFSQSYSQSIQLQISLISTNEEHRKRITGIRLASFSEIRSLAELWQSYNPKRRQINLSLILMAGSPVSVSEVRDILPPQFFRFRFRPYVPTRHGSGNSLFTMPASEVLRIKQEFREEGYVVTDDATPTPTEMEFNLASNVTRRRIMASLGVPLDLKQAREV